MRLVARLRLRLRIWSRMLLNLLIYGRTTKPPYIFRKPPN